MEERKPYHDFDDPGVQERDERRRRAIWYHQYGFQGNHATPEEREAERLRQESYDARCVIRSGRPPDTASRIPTDPGVPTSVKPLNGA